MTSNKIYAAEQSLLQRKFPTLLCRWETRELIEQLVTPLLERDEANHIHQKLHEGLHGKAGVHLQRLLHLIEVDKRHALCRVVIAIKVLRECFGDELTDDSDSGGSGGFKNRILMRPGLF